MKWLYSKLIIILIWILILGVMLLWANLAEAPAIRKVEAQTITERDDIDRLIDQLAWCESRDKDHPNGNENAINPHDPDTGSYGLLQFKEDTFYRYNAIYRIIPDLERQEVANVIFDGSVQKRLAREIIKDGGWGNWYNCLRKYFE